MPLIFPTAHSGGVQGPSVQRANLAIDTATVGNNTLIAANTNRLFRVHQLLVLASGTCTIYFTDGTDNILGSSTAAIRLSADGSAGPAGFVLNFSPVGHFETQAHNRPLVLVSDAAVDFSGYVTYALAEAEA